MFRGFLISGLLSFNMEKWKANIIQSVIFGLGHCFVVSKGLGFHISALAAILHTSQQMMIGYVLGKIYLKTNSLLPGIILHGLLDGVSATFQ